LPGPMVCCQQIVQANLLELDLMPLGRSQP
jgi:hypothetical protein